MPLLKYLFIPIVVNLLVQPASSDTPDVLYQLWLDSEMYF